MQLYLFACITLVGTLPPWILWFQQGTSGTSVRVPGARVRGLAAFLGNSHLSMYFEKQVPVQSWNRAV